MNPIYTSLLNFYGIFLIVCGVTAVVFIGMKAKTALVSGGMSGGTILVISYLISQNVQGVYLAGIGVSLALFVVFSWRATKTLFALFEMIPEKNPEVKGKGIAFLIIALMAIVSLVVFAAQIILFR